MTSQSPDVQSRPAGASESRRRLRLFVTGTTPRSIRAILDTRRLCHELLDGRYELEIIDLYQQPDLARDAQVLAAPTLVVELPGARQRLTGDLADRERIARFLAQVREAESLALTVPPDTGLVKSL